MNAFQSLADRIRRGDPIPFPIAALLSALTPVTTVAMNRRLRAPRVRVEARVISYGNLTAGGSGKTPAVIERVQHEMAAGHRVAVLTRGYGAANREPALIDTAKPQPNLAARIGDEPALIATKVPGVIIAKDADRVAAARRAIDTYQCDTLILDDGYQYVRLERDENVLVIDAVNPWGSGHLLPRGILREPLSAIDRATHLLLTRCDQAADLDALIADLALRGPKVPIRTTRHAPQALIHGQSKRHEPVTLIAGKPVIAACAIGHPEAFFRTLESLGATIRQRIVLPDHAQFAPPLGSADCPVIVTEKDLMRVESPGDHVWALAIHLEDLR